MISGESLVVGLTAPSGTGKSFMTDAILRKWPDFQRPVVATTRAPREQEFEAHRLFLTEAEFAQAVSAGDIVLPHRPFRSEDTPEYGFVTSTFDCEAPVLTEVHSSMIAQFRNATANRKVIMVGMVASSQTLEGNMIARHAGSNIDGFTYRIDSSELERQEIADAKLLGLLDIVVEYEPDERRECERAVLDLIASRIEVSH